ncbi:hypothetical protein BSKO_11018 [Bryopsis sp. KO-2023]|nr:hypothetical protein BSKO_11018 [Bryopsis sp. KO-2023]
MTMGVSLFIALPLFLVIGSVQGLGEVPRIPGVDTDWEDFLEERELKLVPNKCKVFKFDSKKSEFKITLDVSDFDGCDPMDIELSKVYYEGQCFKRESTVSLTCEEPGKYGVERKADICDNFADLSTETFDPDETDGTTKDIQGNVCFEESSYYFAMKSSCNETSTVKISVDQRSLTKVDDATCLGLFSFREGEKSFGYKLTHEYLWLLILVLVVVVILLPAAITLCVCFCACCQCCACCVKIAKAPCKCAECILKPIKKILCCCK